MKLKLFWQGASRELSQAQLQNKLEAELKRHGLSGSVELGISFVDEETMRKLNFKHRGRNQATDVLSFPLDQELGPDKVTRLGDLVVCLPVAVNQAEKLGVDRQT